MPNDLIDQSLTLTLNATALARDCQELLDGAVRKLRSFEAFERELEVLSQDAVTPTEDHEPV